MYMKVKPAQLAGLVLAGATAATLALLPFIGASNAPQGPVEAPRAGVLPEPDAPAAGAISVTPPGGGSLGLVQEANGRAPRDPTLCVQRVRGEREEPATLTALLACQEAARKTRRVDEAYVEFQRSEVREYLSRHPDRATTEVPPGPKKR